MEIKNTQNNFYIYYKQAADFFYTEASIPATEQIACTDNHLAKYKYNGSGTYI